MHLKNTLLCLFLIITGSVLAACKPENLSSPVTPTAQAGTLIPFVTTTPSLTPNLTLMATYTPLPSATPTPRVYTVKRGDSLSSIAWAYGINLSDLQAANPTVDPYMLQPGMTLALPEVKPDGGGTQPAPAATPVPVQIDPPVCYPSLDGSAWCFSLVHNGNSFAVENITAKIRLSASNSELVAITPLDVIPAGETLPLVAHFAAPVESPVQADAFLLTGVPLMGGDERYLVAKIDSRQITISPDGKSAVATGNVILEGSRPSSLIWVAAVAYDSKGQIVGARRWAYPEALDAQTPLPFSINIYSMAGAIAQVDLFAEARP